MSLPNIAASQKLEAALLEILDASVVTAGNIGSDYADLLAELRTLIRRGGKRSRPLLCINSFQSYGGHNPAIYDVAAGLELFHAFLLIHDDIIDRDTTRWNGPNITGIYLNRFQTNRPRSNRQHAAQSWAILAGDTCSSLAYQAITTADFSPTKTLSVLRLLQNCQFEVIGGELLDTAASISPSQLNEITLQQINYFKTVTYSFILPLQVGALLAGADMAALAAIKAAVKPIGIAYQLQDDLLGMFGDPACTGKSNLSDLSEHKQTILLNYARANASRNDAQRLEMILSKEKINLADRAIAQRILLASGAKTYTEQRISQLFLDGQAILKVSNAPPEFITMLTAHVANLQNRSH